MQKLYLVVANPVDPRIDASEKMSGFSLADARSEPDLRRVAAHKRTFTRQTRASASHWEWGKMGQKDVRPLFTSFRAFGESA
jgi:hypothetical protein